MLGCHGAPNAIPFPLWLRSWEARHLLRRDATRRDSLARLELLVVHLPLPPLCTQLPLRPAHDSSHSTHFCLSFHFITNHRQSSSELTLATTTTAVAAPYTHTHTPNTYTPHTHTHTNVTYTTVAIGCWPWNWKCEIVARRVDRQPPSTNPPSSQYHPLFLFLSLSPISTCNGIYFVAHFHVGCESNHAQSASQYLEYDISQKSTHKAIATTTTTIRKPKMKFCMRLPGIKTTTITLVRSCTKLWADKQDTL